MNLHRFKLYRSHSISFSSSSVGNLFGSWILTDCIEVQEKKSKVVVLCLPTSSTKREISHFLVVVVQWPQRNVQKSVAARAKLLICQSNLLLLCRSRWRRRRRCLSSLMFDCYPLATLSFTWPRALFQLSGVYRQNSPLSRRDGNWAELTFAKTPGRVRSNDLRNNCGAHFGASLLLVSTKTSTPKVIGTYAAAKQG